LKIRIPLKIPKSGIGMKKFHVKFIPLMMAAPAVQFVMIQTTRAQTWATNNPLNVARWSHTATLLPNGQVLVVGGTVYNVDGDFQDTNACELYDPLTGTSTLTGFMQDARHSHTATLLTNGQVLVAGSGGDASSEVYDPTNGSWGFFQPVQP
jgi:hypothetical protein